MSPYKSIHQFIGEHEALRSVRYYEKMTVLLTETRLVQTRHDDKRVNPEEVQEIRTVQLDRPTFTDRSAELEPERAIVSFHGSTGRTVRLVTLPVRDFEFATTFSAVVGNAKVGVPLAGD